MKNPGDYLIRFGQFAKRRRGPIAIAEIAQMDGGLAWLHWLAQQELRDAAAKAAVVAYLAQPEVVPLVKLVLQQEADRRNDQRRTAGNWAQRQRQLEYGY